MRSWVIVFGQAGHAERTARVPRVPSSGLFYSVMLVRVVRYWELLIHRMVISHVQSFRYQKSDEAKSRAGAMQGRIRHVLQ